MKDNKRKIYEFQGIACISNFRIVSMNPGNLQGLPDVCFSKLFLGVC
ncbi:MAG: hypothetical protein Q7S39_03745 [Ignavibacteria bacterium]|nr:hypothetical protein [Ignavibacteria bacterium]